MINGRMSIGVNIHMGVHSKEVKCSHICTGMWFAEMIHNRMHSVGMSKIHSEEMMNKRTHSEEMLNEYTHV